MEGQFIKNAWPISVASCSETVNWERHIHWGRQFAAFSWNVFSILFYTLWPDSAASLGSSAHEADSYSNHRWLSARSGCPVPETVAVALNELPRSKNMCLQKQRSVKSRGRQCMSKETVSGGIRIPILTMISHKFPLTYSLFTSIYGKCEQNKAYVFISHRHNSELLHLLHSLALKASISGTFASLHVLKHHSTDIPVWR